MAAGTAVPSLPRPVWEGRREMQPRAGLARPRLRIRDSCRSAPAVTCSATSSRRPCRSSGRGASGLGRPEALPPGVTSPWRPPRKRTTRRRPRASTTPDERPGAGRRRARLREDERQDAVRRRRQPAERGRRHREATPEAARLAEARQRLEPRAPARRRPPARALARRLLADAAARPAGARAAVLPATSALSEIDVSNPKALRLVGRSRSTAATSTRASSARAHASSSPRRCRRSCPS